MPAIRSKRATVAAAGLAALALLGACSAQSAEEPAASTPPASAPAEQTSPTPEPGAAEAPALAAGGYVDLEAYEADPASHQSGDVVLFFNASWCPTCRAADSNFASAAFPAGLTIVSVDFDDNTELRQEYGVTVQHTFVQVDAAGSEVAKWSGSTTVDEVADRLA